MRTKYFGFNGSNLVEVGEFENLCDALEHADTMGDFFYVTCLDSWAIFASEIVMKLREEAGKK